MPVCSGSPASLGVAAWRAARWAGVEALPERVVGWLAAGAAGRVSVFRAQPASSRAAVNVAARARRKGVVMMLSCALGPAVPRGCREGWTDATTAQTK
jgi:hypothetical protein